VQARLNDRYEGRLLIRIGLAIIVLAIAGMALVLEPGVPVAEAIAAWTVGGLGMGLAYAPITLLMLRQAPPGQEGQSSASLNLADTLGTAIGIGVGGAAVAAVSGSSLHLGLDAAFAAAALAGVVALILSRRLPAGTTVAAQPRDGDPAREGHAR
jgi:MFS family permease